MALHKKECACSPCSCKTKTTLIIKCNSGFPNNLFLRGEGIAELNWEKGVKMENIKADEWRWETSASFTKAQVKVLLNDRVYETGANHVIECGQTVTFTPTF
jgi:hypothetical protein